MVITPWEVKGDIDYEKLVKEFGVTPLTELPTEFAGNLLYRRKFVFAHRSLGSVISAYEHKKPYRAYDARATNHLLAKTGRSRVHCCCRY
jgi:tryptophanyl-tRNA synthetase